MNGTEGSSGAARIALELPKALATRTPEALEPLLDVLVRWGGTGSSPEYTYARADVLDFYWQVLTSGVMIEVRDLVVADDHVLLRAWVSLPTGDTFDREVQLTVRDGLIGDVREDVGGLTRDEPVIEVPWLSERAHQWPRCRARGPQS